MLFLIKNQRFLWLKRVSVLSIGLTVSEPAIAQWEHPKRQLHGDMTLGYSIVPESVDTIEKMFSKGILYGRLRSHTFYWDWAQEDYRNGGSKKDNRVWGIGGSIEYKLARYYGLSATTALYGSFNPDFFQMSPSDIGYLKAGKDMLSRNLVKEDGSYLFYTVGKAFLEYSNSMIDIRAGRQLFESMFTKSNDTKMIPNSFDGVTITAKIAPKTKVRAAYFTAQKLRDHENSHDVITFKNAAGESWANNDDSAVHRGLSYQAFEAAGEDTEHKLYLVDFRTTYIENMDLTLGYLQVPGVVKDFAIEAGYQMPLGESGWYMRPAFRYFLQYDDGGGKVAADTNLLGRPATPNGYAKRVADSMDSGLLNTRIDLILPDHRGFFRAAYSGVADKADIVAPWRGFPTGGYTRAMGQYNWYANTKTYMLRVFYRFEESLRGSLRYAIQDFDDRKDFVPADSRVWNLDVCYDIDEHFEVKFRTADVKADKNTPKMHTGGVKIDTSYREFRLEFNYLF